MLKETKLEIIQKLATIGEVIKNIHKINIFVLANFTGNPKLGYDSENK